VCGIEEKKMEKKNFFSRVSFKLFLSFYYDCSLLFYSPIFSRNRVQMQDNKWSSSQTESMTNYMPLPYSYNGEYPPHSNDQSTNSESSSQPVLPVSPPLQQG
jgi:hypothetical protein